MNNSKYLPLERLKVASRSQLILAYLLLLVGGCDLNGNGLRENREPGPIDVSVVPEMLVGAQYRGRTGVDEYDDLAWVFDKTHFRIVAGQRGLPADLVTALLPADVTGNRIDGRWSVDGEVLTVTELTLDGKAIDLPPRTLRAMCTPVVRIQSAKHQYMFARGTAESAWRQGDIPQWPPGTTSVSGSVKFDRKGQGWLSVGYRGVIGETELIADSATLKWEPDDTGYGSAQTKTYAPRFCLLQLNGSQPSTMQCMALPPGIYFFYAMWEPPDPRSLEGKIVVKGERWRLQNQFVAKWIVVDDRPVAPVNFDLVAAADGEIEIRVPKSDTLQSAFLLPWGLADTDPPPLDADEAWRMAYWAGHQISINAGNGTFKNLPGGRHSLFLVEHDEPARDWDALTEFRVTGETIVTVHEGEKVEVSF
ncbi:MAG: hypothetical protein ACI87E_003176 [Mariniblastus sp.]|jgi:hypothetical protein